VNQEGKMIMKFRAEYRRHGSVIKTRFYDDRKTAQDQLAKRIGYFHHLGRVCGDASNAAPRNGGLVTIEER